MSEIFKPQPKEVVQSWIDALNNEASDTLSQWETEFIESCQKGINHYGVLTKKMQDILERIYAEKTK